MSISDKAEGALVASRRLTAGLGNQEGASQGRYWVGNSQAS